MGTYTDLPPPVHPQGLPLKTPYLMHKLQMLLWVPQLGPTQEVTDGFLKPQAQGPPDFVGIVGPDAQAAKFMCLESST